VIDNHHFLDIFNIEVLSSNKSAVVSLGVHEIVVEGEDFDAESFSGVGADALLGDSEVVDNPHVLLDVSDVRSLVEVGGHMNIQVHLESVLFPVVNELAFLPLVAMLFSRIGSREATNAGRVSLVSDHDFRVFVLGELEGEFGIVLLNVFR